MPKKENNLFSKILWFEKRLKFDIDFYDILQPQRSVNEHHRYKSGVYYSEKCKREIQYESGIELDFIKMLEESKRVKFYYEQPVQIKYWRGRRKVTYTPDFGVYLNTKEFVLVEIKDLPGMIENLSQMKTEALVDFCCKKGFGLLFTDGKNTIDKILKVKINRKLEKDILSAVRDNVLRKKQCKEILKKCNATQNELLKIIIRQDLKFRSYPMKLQTGGKNEIFRHVFIDKKPYEDLIKQKYDTLFKPIKP